MFLNVNEHLAVPFVEWVRGGYHVGHLCFFCLHWLTCRRSHNGLKILIAQNLPCYFNFAFCFFVWLIQLKFVPHPSHH